MKRLYFLSFALLCFAHTALAQDTVRFTGCTRLWQNLKPIKGTNIKVEVSSFGEYSTPTGFDKHCVDMSIPLTGLPGNSTVSVYGSKASNGYAELPLNGVSVGDLMKINCHILGLQPLPSQFGWFAADANRSGSITTFDIVELRKLVLGIYQKLPNPPVWYFLPEYYEFPDPINPFGGMPSGDKLTLSEFQAYDGDTIGVFGMKTGDLDGDANLDGPYTGSPKPADTLLLTIPNMALPANTPVEVPVFLQQGAPIGGLQVQFNTWSNLRILGFTKGLENMAPDYFHRVDSVQPFEAARLVLMRNASQGSVFSWSPTKPLFHIQVQSPVATEVKQRLSLGEAIPALGFTACGAKPYKLLLRFSNTVSTEQPAAVSLNATPAAPNPFTDKALVKIELPEAMPVLLEVFDLSGRLTWAQEQTLGSGQQQLEIPAEAVAPGSMGLYRIRAGAGTATGKVVRE
jgi:hypothetical protein